MSDEKRDDGGAALVELDAIGAPALLDAGDRLAAAASMMDQRRMLADSDNLNRIAAWLYSHAHNLMAAKKRRREGR